MVTASVVLGSEVCGAGALGVGAVAQGDASQVVPEAGDVFGRGSNRSACHHAGFRRGRPRAGSAGGRAAQVLTARSAASARASTLRALGRGGRAARGAGAQYLLAFGEHCAPGDADQRVEVQARQIGHGAILADNGNTERFSILLAPSFGSNAQVAEAALPLPPGSRNVIGTGRHSRHSRQVA